MCKTKGLGRSKEINSILFYMYNIECCTQHQEGSPALSLAAERGHVDAMMALIERGADVNAQYKVII